MDNNKPPLGLIPQHLWEEDRLAEIDAAISRYEIFDKPVPQEWKEERAWLYERFQHMQSKLAPKPPLYRRLGRVKVPKFLLEEQLDQEYFKVFFSEFYPTDIVKYPFDHFDNVVYHGYSLHFRQLEEGEEVPEYQFVFMRTVGEAKGIDLNGRKIFEAVTMLQKVKEVINRPFVHKRHG